MDGVFVFFFFAHLVNIFFLIFFFLQIPIHSHSNRHVHISAKYRQCTNFCPKSCTRRIFEWNLKDSLRILFFFTIGEIVKAFNPYLPFSIGNKQQVITVVQTCRGETLQNDRTENSTQFVCNSRRPFSMFLSSLVLWSVCE